MTSASTALTPGDVDALGRLDATAQAALVRSGELTAADLVESAIRRVERLDPTYNAVVTRDFDRARDAADRLGRDAAGRRTQAAPFAGVPFLVKDLGTEVAGVRLCEGSAFLRDNVSSRDQHHVTRLRRAGLVLLGKTNTPEFGMAPTTEPRLFGATANPWDVTRSVGGSSGGSAAAVAAGMVPMAYANDVGGSIRIPASCCGLFGFKPSRGRGSWGPEYGDLFGGLASEHVLTRTVRDSAALLDATSGAAPGDPYSAAPPDRPFVTEATCAPGRLRIAVSVEAAEDRPVHPECVRAVRQVAGRLADLGHEVVELGLPPITQPVGAAIGRMYGAGVDWIVRYWARHLGRAPGDDDLEPLTRLYWERGQAVTGGEYLLAVTTLQQYARQVGLASTEVDAWLSPTVAEPAPRLGEMRASDANPQAAEQRSARFTAIPLIVGAPAMSVPLHRTPAGLPVGVHLMGRPGEDATLFRLAGQLEQAMPWADRWPDPPARMAG